MKKKIIFLFLVFFSQPTIMSMNKKISNDLYEPGGKRFYIEWIRSFYDKQKQREEEDLRQKNREYEQDKKCPQMQSLLKSIKNTEIKKN